MNVDDSADRLSTAVELSAVTPRSPPRHIFALLAEIPVGHQSTKEVT